MTIRVGVMLALLIGVPGCATSPTRPDEGPPPEPTVSPAVPDGPVSEALPAGAPTVKLRSPGATPRQTLRYTAAAEPEVAILELSSQVRVSAGQARAPEVHSPTIRLTLNLTSREAGPGRLTIDGRVVQIDVIGAASVPAAVTEAVRSDVEPLVGNTFQIALDDRGLDAKLELPDPTVVNPQLTHLLDRLRRTLPTLWLPLPLEEVGRGGDWEVRRLTTSAGATVDETLRISVTEASPARIRLLMGLTHTAREQALTPTGLPAGARLVLQSLRGTGEGKAEFTRSRIVQPFELRWTSRGHGRLDTPNEPTGRLDLEITEQIVLRRGRP